MRANRLYAFGGGRSGERSSNSLWTDRRFERLNCARSVVNEELAPRARFADSDQDWPVGTSAEVDWIAGGTGISLSITAAIPPVFAAYATLIVPDSDEGRAQHDEAVLSVLSEHSAGQPWWLGHLETGADSVVFPDAPKVTLYTGWRYVLIQAAREQAATWRSNDPLSWRGALPDLIFPLNHSWLVSRLWDDDWRCVGGSRELVSKLCLDRRLEARAVTIEEDATPPGHQAR